MTASTGSTKTESILDTMIQLAPAARLHRVVVAGSDAPELHRGLYRRGFCCVSTMPPCKAAVERHDVAMISGQHSIQVIEALLVHVVQFLNRSAMIVVWIDGEERQRGSKIQIVLERQGFGVECGTKCEMGFVLAARRGEWHKLAEAA
jgi:hypothetical protein